MLSYKVTANLLPTELPEDIACDIFRLVKSKFQTVAYSIDDAIFLVENGQPGSKLKVWNANYHDSIEYELIFDSKVEIEEWHAKGLVPHIQVAISDLERIGDYPDRSFEDIFVVTIHHSVGWDFSASTLENAKRISSYHVNTHKWPGIGYHYLIGPTGEILQTNELLKSSYHAGSYSAPGDENKTAIGICLGGDFRNAPPPDCQVAAASSLVQYIRQLPKMANSISVIPHKRMPGAATICPGYNIEPWLRQISGEDEWN